MSGVIRQDKKELCLCKKGLDTSANSPRNLDCSDPQERRGLEPSKPSAAIFLRLRLRLSDALEKSAAIFEPRKCLTRPESLAIFPCDARSQTIAILFAIFSGEERESVLVAAWLATGAFAKKNRGNFRGKAKPAGRGPMQTALCFCSLPLEFWFLKDKESFGLCFQPLALKTQSLSSKEASPRQNKTDSQ